MVDLEGGVDGDLIAILFVGPEGEQFEYDFFGELLLELYFECADARARAVEGPVDVVL